MSATAPDTATASTAASFTLTIPDEHLVSWMPIENGFTKKRGASFDYHGGFLVQLGRYFNIMSRQKVNMSIRWNAVKITGDKGEVKLGFKDFHWINVVDASRDQPPLSRQDAGLLFADPAAPPTRCADVQACVESLMPGESRSPCFCAGPDCASSPALANLPSSCVRQRAIHAHFDAHKAITLWGGTSGWTITSTPQGHNGHQRFVFSSADPMNVTVYKQSAPVALDIGTVQAIEVMTDHDDAHSDHGEVHEPPIGSGFGSGP